MRRTLVFAGVFAVVALVASSAALAGGGNSANAKLCQKNGWMTLYKSDGTTFTSEQECVSYGAQGGSILTEPPSAGQLACAEVGGTFSTDPNTDRANFGFTFVWSCNGVQAEDNDDAYDITIYLAVACSTGGSGYALAQGNEPGFILNSTCYRDVPA